MYPFVSVSSTLYSPKYSSFNSLLSPGDNLKVSSYPLGPVTLNSNFTGSNPLAFLTFAPDTTRFFFTTNLPKFSSPLTALFFIVATPFFTSVLSTIVQFPLFTSSAFLKLSFTTKV